MCFGLCVLVYARITIKEHTFNPDPSSVPIETTFSKFNQMNNALYYCPQFFETCPFRSHLSKDTTFFFSFFCSKYGFEISMTGQ